MKHFFYLLAFLSIHIVNAQMSNKLIEQTIAQKVSLIKGENGRWKAIYNDTPLIILTDSINDRMRIMTPIIEENNLDDELLKDCLTANYHAALDVKYALSNGLLWSVYIHPLSPLSKKEIISAIEQVHMAAITFGTTFSSTPLLFGGQKKPVKLKQKDCTNLIRT